MLSLFYAILIGYVFGCLHGSQIIGKIKKVDIKNSGVKNAGASNTTIVLGWKFGIIVALIDIFKGVFAILLFKWLMESSSLSYEDMMIFLTGAFVIIGHNYPITMKFQGGKGTASFIGMLFAIDWKIALISVAVLLIITFATDYLVIGVLCMYLSFTITTYLFDFGFLSVTCAFFLTVLSAYKHTENYERIRLKTETKISSMLKKNKS